MRRHTFVGHLLTVLTYVLALVLFFPILWMVLTSFKHEVVAFSIPPQFFFEPTLDNWRIAIVESPFFDRLGNTLLISLISTAGALLFGIPAAYRLALYPGKWSDFTLLWIISTRMLPPVGIIIPLYIIFRDIRILDTHLGLIFIYTAMNLPLVIWMMRSFLQEVPYEVIEAARIDGASFFEEMRYVVLPMMVPGLISTALLCFIFAWNEFFFAFNLTVSNAVPLSVYIASFKTAEGLFWAKMSAAATAAVLPVVLAGWLAQRQLVRGLTMGAIK